MHKAKGYNPGAGDWFWVKYGTDGSVAKAGKPADCISCHGSAADNDYVMVQSFD